MAKKDPLRNVGASQVSFRRLLHLTIQDVMLTQYVQRVRGLLSPLSSRVRAPPPYDTSYDNEPPDDT